MTGGTVRKIETDEEIRAYVTGMRIAFLDGKDIKDESIEWFRSTWDFDRIWAAFDDGDGRQCATTRTFPSGLRLPGNAEVPVSCLTQVTCLPTHTRRGHVTRLMREQLEAAVEAGEVASLLVAAEWPIYGRFGYGPISEWVEWQVDVDRSELKRSLAPPVGACQLVTPAELLEPLQEIHFAQQAHTPGSITRLPYMFPLDAGVELRPQEEKKESRVRVLHRDADGRADGFVIYDPKDVWEGMRPRSTLKIVEMAWTTPTAERELWRYLLDVDLISRIDYDGSPNAAVRHLLVNGRDAHAAGRWDHLWAVVLDIPTAFEARAYTGTGTVVVEVLDNFLGRGGTFTFDLAPDGVTVAPTPSATAQLTVTLSALSAAWLGGTDLRHIAVAGDQIQEHERGALVRFASLLRWHETPDSFTDF